MRVGLTILLEDTPLATLALRVVRNDFHTTALTPTFAINTTPELAIKVIQVAARAEPIGIRLWRAGFDRRGPPPRGGGHTRQRTCTFDKEPLEDVQMLGDTQRPLRRSCRSLRPT